MVIPVWLALYPHGQHKHRWGSPWCSPQGTFWRSCQSLHVSTCFKFHRSQLWFEAPQIPKTPFSRSQLGFPSDLSTTFHDARKDHLGRPRGKATKETVGKGYLIGEAALYGEAYPFGGQQPAVVECMVEVVFSASCMMFLVANVPTGRWLRFFQTCSVYSDYSVCCCSFRFWTWGEWSFLFFSGEVGRPISIQLYARNFCW